MAKFIHLPCTYSTEYIVRQKGKQTETTMRTYKFVGEITNQDLEERRIASGTSCHFNEPERRGLVSLIPLHGKAKGFV